MNFPSRFIQATFVLIILMGLMRIPRASAQSPCGDTYVVLPGDTLAGIANRCGVTEQAILALNPDITNPTQIYVGQVLRLPDPTKVKPPELAISPTCGEPGSQVFMLGSGFPGDAPVQISVGQKGQPAIIIGNLLSDQYGRIQTTLRIPSSAIPEKAWLIYAESLTGVPILKGISTDFWIVGFAPDPNAGTTYIVQQGDTLQSIATKFNRSFEAILDANPQIANLTDIRAGQRIFIPAQEENYPTTTILPECGPAGNSIQASGREFTPSTIVNFKMGEYLTSYLPAGTAFIQPDKTFNAPLVIPLAGEAGQHWVVLAESTGSPFIRSMSNIYSVTPPVDPNAASIYFVKAGDTLNEIAVSTQRTVNSILVANPQISNPNQLSVNQVLLIPGLEPTIVIAPPSGPAFTVVQVLGVAYPVNSKVEIGVSKKGTPPQFVEIVTTDSVGNFTSQAIIPGTAKTGERWVISARYVLPNGTLVTRTSSDFIIAQPSPTHQPILTIWPTIGPAGETVFVVANYFPPLTQVSIDLTKSGETPLPLLTTWSDINGSFAREIEVPDSSKDGDTWTITAKVTNNPGVTATSEEFIVSNP